jgi:hypothetical protein
MPPSPVFSARCALFGLGAFLLAGCTSTLNQAASRDHGEQVERYLAGGADVNQRDRSGATPLINAGQTGDLAVIRKLVEHGAYVNAVDHDGYCALMYLASGDSYANEAVDFLLHHGARTDLRANDGHTVLMLAVSREVVSGNEKSETRLVSLLLDSGASTVDASNDGERPLHLAAYEGQPDACLGLLLQATPDDALLDRSGRSALSEAARGDHRGSQEFLVGCGLTPQNLPPAVPAHVQGPFPADPSFAVNARSFDAYGDFLASKGDSADALHNFQLAAGAYAAALGDCQAAIDRYSKALAVEKDARTRRIEAAVALSAVGVALGAATGVGAVFIPRRIPNPIGDYKDTLDVLRADLKSLTSEQALMAAKLSRSGPPAPKI